MRSLGVWGPVCGTSPSGGLPCTSAPFGACNQPNYLRTAHVAGSSACSLHRLHQLPGVKPPVGGLLAVPSRSCSTIYGCSKLRLQVCNSYKSGGPRALQTGSFGRSTAAECALGPDAHILLPAHGPLQVAALQVVVEDEAQTLSSRSKSSSSGTNGCNGSSLLQPLAGSGAACLTHQTQQQQQQQEATNGVGCTAQHHTNDTPGDYDDDGGAYGGQRSAHLRLGRPAVPVTSRRVQDAAWQSQPSQPAVPVADAAALADVPAGGSRARSVPEGMPVWEVQARRLAAERTGDLRAQVPYVEQEVAGEPVVTRRGTGVLGTGPVAEVPAVPLLKPHTGLGADRDGEGDGAQRGQGWVSPEEDGTAAGLQGEARRSGLGLAQAHIALGGGAAVSLHSCSTTTATTATSSSSSRHPPPLSSRRAPPPRRSLQPLTPRYDPVACAPVIHARHQLAKQLSSAPDPHTLVGLLRAQLHLVDPVCVSAAVCRMVRLLRRSMGQQQAWGGDTGSGAPLERDRWAGGDRGGMAFAGDHYLQEEGPSAGGRGGAEGQDGQQLPQTVDSADRMLDAFLVLVQEAVAICVADSAGRSGRGRRGSKRVLSGGQARVAVRPFRPQEVANVVWGLACLRPRDMVLGGCRRTQRTLLQLALELLPPQPTQAGPGPRSGSGLGAAQGGAQGRAWGGGEQGGSRWRWRPGELAMLGWGMAQAEVDPPSAEWVGSYLAAWDEQALAAAAPREVACLAWTLARWSLRAEAQGEARGVPAAARRRWQQQGAGSQGGRAEASGVAGLGGEEGRGGRGKSAGELLLPLPDLWLDAFWRATLDGLEQRLAGGEQQQQQLWQQDAGQSQHSRTARGIRAMGWGPSELAMLLWSVGHLRPHVPVPPEPWLLAALRAAAAVAPAAPPLALATTLRGAARLGAAAPAVEGSVPGGAAKAAHVPAGTANDGLEAIPGRAVPPPAGDRSPSGPPLSPPQLVHAIAVHQQSVLATATAPGAALTAEPSPTPARAAVLALGQLPRPQPALAYPPSHHSQHHQQLHAPPRQPPPPPQLQSQSAVAAFARGYLARCGGAVGRFGPSQVVDLLAAVRLLSVSGHLPAGLPLPRLLAAACHQLQRCGGALGARHLLHIAVLLAALQHVPCGPTGRHRAHSAANRHNHLHVDNETDESGPVEACSGGANGGGAASGAGQQQQEQEQQQQPEAYHVAPSREWLSWWLDEMYGRLGSLEGHELAAALRALTSLGCRPGPTWRMALLAAAERQLPAMTRRGLTELAAAMAGAGVVLPGLVRQPAQPSSVPTDAADAADMGATGMTPMGGAAEYGARSDRWLTCFLDAWGACLPATWEAAAAARGGRGPRSRGVLVRPDQAVVMCGAVLAVAGGPVGRWPRGSRAALGRVVSGQIRPLLAALEARAAEGGAGGGEAGQGEAVWAGCEGGSEGQGDVGKVAEGATERAKGAGRALLQLRAALEALGLEA